ncbi:MAG: hypothetical protein J6H31_08170 [Butyrivibrio sp.]|nr:hypothetical protein [Butyrivibrio sp.]
MNLFSPSLTTMVSRDDSNQVTGNHAIKFEFAQAHRFSRNYKNTQPLKAYEWDDTLAEFAKKILLDEVTLGKYDKGDVFDNTGRFDQSSVYCFDKYFLGTTGYPYDIELTITAKGKTIDETIMGCVGEESLRNILIQQDGNMKVGAAVLNHNGEKLLLFVKSEEGKTDIWDYINDHGGVDKVIYDFGMPVETFHSIHPN